MAGGVENEVLFNLDLGCHNEKIRNVCLLDYLPKKDHAFLDPQCARE